MPSIDRFVIQRKAGNGGIGGGVNWSDWTNPMDGRSEYETHAQAVTALTRRANRVDYRIVRRTYTWADAPVGMYL